MKQGKHVKHKAKRRAAEPQPPILRLVSDSKPDDRRIDRLTEAVHLLLTDNAYAHHALMGGEPSRFSRTIAEVERLTGLLPREPL